jgi:hypothetical protein
LKRGESGQIDRQSESFSCAGKIFVQLGDRPGYDPRVSFQARLAIETRKKSAFVSTEVNRA